MRLEFKTHIESREVTFLHEEDYYPWEIEECLIFWNCRIPVEREGLTKIEVDVKVIKIKYYRLNEKQEKLDLIARELKLEPRVTRVRFIDKNPNPSIKPVGLWVSYENEKFTTPVVEFTK